GAQSIFEKLYDRNAWLVFLGETFDITYMHFVEQKVGIPYRFKKQFAGQLRKNGRVMDASFDYNVRMLDRGVIYDLDKIARRLHEANVLRCVRLGHSKVRAVRAVDAFKTLQEALKSDIYFLLKAPPTS